MTSDDFDQRLRAALDVGESPAQLARLEQYWRQQSRADLRRRRTRRVLAAAAALVVAASAVYLLPFPANQPIAPQQTVAQAPPPNKIEPTSPPAPIEQPPRDPAWGGPPPTAVDP